MGVSMMKVRCSTETRSSTCWVFCLVPDESAGVLPEDSPNRASLEEGSPLQGRLCCAEIGPSNE